MSTTSLSVQLVSAVLYHMDCTLYLTEIPGIISLVCRKDGCTLNEPTL
jgi:hypothetical protein